MIYDFHSHILPKVDDGAANLETACKMLEKSAEAGVDVIVSTSHCYPRSENDIKDFLTKRERAFSELENAPIKPRIVKACEVHLTGDLTEYKNLDKLCIENTNYMLLEMPVHPWNDSVIDNVYKLTINGIKPIIAHDERNFAQSPQTRDMLYDLDILIQINAPSFMMPAFKKHIDKAMERGMVHIIGTDMHNLESRPPCMDKAKAIIEKRYGKDCWEYLMTNAKNVLNGEEITYNDFRSFKKNGLLKKVKVSHFYS